jgi:hypothetical protein
MRQASKRVQSSRRWTLSGSHIECPAVPPRCENYFALDLQQWGHRSRHKVLNRASTACSRMGALAVFQVK